MTWVGVRTPENIKQIIQEIAARHNVSFSMAKYRLIELGFTKAEGIGVYLDNAYIPDHGTANGWPEKTTYTLSLMAAAHLTEESIELGGCLRNGRYVYVEGHFCLNQKKYLYRTRMGQGALTPYARAHIDE
ncbi:hypothetical protein JFI80_03525 [Enterococcus faecium]|nr:hypothetical protein [Enterococcus faecium]